ncbi:MAG: pyridoxal phosphate-dependent aminotransferase [Desulfobacteraceae bacterium]|nr:pyridoxal phosphate-dependent aminotransferase [Desulfobacteraceae bacterium]
MDSHGRSALAADGKTFRTRGISRRVNQITISAIKEMPLLASRIGGCVSLGQGIPSFPTPEHIREAVCRVIREDAHSGKYTLGPGMPELRQAVAAHLFEDRGIAADPDRELCITVGAMEGLCAAVLTVVDRGDEVILPSPNYASHIEQVLLAEGIPVFVPLRKADWGLDVDAIREAITPRTRAIVICNPHNPTGANFARKDLEALISLALERDIFIISDETYDFLVYDGKTCFNMSSVAELKENLIAVFSFSKKYAMTGWRAGCVYASEGVLDHIMKVHDAVAIAAPTVSQHAALAALRGPQNCVDEVRSALESRRNLVCERLDRMKDFFDYVKPAGAYYLMARFKAPGVDSMTFALRLMKEARVITIPGAAFGPGGEQHIRISFGGADSEISEACDRIERWLSTNPFGS